MEKEAIPAQRRGAHFDVRQSRMVEHRADAIIQHELAVNRLLDITHWGDFGGESPDAFILTDDSGELARRPAVAGDHIKIHLPGPRSFSGDGADWVRIESIITERNKMLDEVFTALTVRPCANPISPEKTIAHFYNDRSTNTFLVCRHKTELVASVHGRNELVNTDTNWLDLIRNLMVALPAKAGLSDPHWERLAKGLIAR